MKLYAVTVNSDFEKIERVTTYYRTIKDLSTWERKGIPSNVANTVRFPHHSKIPNTSTANEKNVRRKMMGKSMNKTAKAMGGKAPCIIPFTTPGNLHNHANQLYVFSFLHRYQR